MKNDETTDEPRKKIPRHIEDSPRSPSPTPSPCVVNLNLPPPSDNQESEQAMDEEERSRSPSPTLSVTPTYMQEEPRYSDITSRLQRLAEQETTPATDHQSYNENKDRELTLWLNTTVPTTTLVNRIAEALEDTPSNCLIGVHRDTRVQHTNKYTIVLKNDDMTDALKFHGITIEGKRYYPKKSKPRPPPRKRCYVPNFPIAATCALLAEAAMTADIDVLEVTAKKAPRSSVKVGGYIIWASLQTKQPEHINFDGAEYRLIWSDKKKEPTTDPRTNLPEKTALLARENCRQILLTRENCRQIQLARDN